MSAASPNRLIFVLGTGRCGTQSVADLISAVPGCRVDHERRPQLLQEASDYLEGRRAHGEMVALLRATRGADCFSSMRVCGESNQRLSFVLPALNEAVPEASYLWIIRDGRATVDSLHNRFWYYPDEDRLRPTLADWARTRPNGHRLGVFSRTEWQAMDPFARCSWYWAYVNTLIPRKAAELGLDLKCVRLEDLQASLKSIESWLGLEDGELPLPPHSNAGDHHRSAGWSHWSRRQRQAFEHYAGAEMDRWYGNWRDAFEGSSRMGSELVSTWKRSTSSARRRLIGARLRAAGIHPAVWAGKRPSAPIHSAGS